MLALKMEGAPEINSSVDCFYIFTVIQQLSF